MEFVDILLPLLTLIRFALSDNVLHYQIWDESAPGTFIGDLKGDAQLPEKHDYDESILDSLTFAFLTKEREKEYFDLESRTGRLSVGITVDRDIICPGAVDCVINLDVAVQPARYFETIKIQVTVIDKNDNSPRFPQSHMIYELSENSAPGILFPILPASDPDSPDNGIVHYLLDTAADKFNLQVRELEDGSFELHLALMAPLDRESQDRYEVRVLAQDGGVPQRIGELVLDIKVLDVNDNSPVFDFPIGKSSYEVEVPENLPVNHTIIRVHATDADEGLNGKVVYSFASSTTKQYGSKFHIHRNTGNIKSRDPLDFEDRDEYSLTVVAEDSGQDALPSTARVVIKVTDQNDNAPLIMVNALTSTGIVGVLEHEPSDTFVTHISVIDDDTGHNGQVECYLDNSNFRLEEMFEKEYKIVTISELDRERISEYDVQIVCYDFGNPQLQGKIAMTVRVLDTNDHDPVFGQDRYVALIEENNIKGEYITQVHAFDDDIGENGRISYSLDSEGSSYFKVDEDNGVLTADAKLDRETFAAKEFRVIATDNGEPYRSAVATVVVQISDIDDEKPKFTRSKYTFSVHENMPIRTPVGKVSATDTDSSPYDKFTFYIDSRSEGGVNFDVDPHTGEIFTRKMLDRETLEVYQLNVYVRSDKSVTSDDTAFVEIFVSDRNDNAPIIEYPSYHNNTVIVPQTVPPGTVIANIVAKDPDFGYNGKISYLISEGSENGEFIISPDTGRIMVNRDLTDVRREQFVLVVMVRDHAESPKMSVASLNIIINRTEQFIVASPSVGEEPLSGETLAIIIGSVCGFLVIVLIIALTAVLCIKKRRTRTNRRYYDKTNDGAIALDTKTPMTVIDDKKLNNHINNDVSFALTTEAEQYRERQASNESPASSATGEKDSDSGCYADLSHADSQGSSEEAGSVTGAPITARVEHHGTAPGGPVPVVQLKCYHQKNHHLPSQGGPSHRPSSPTVLPPAPPTRTSSFTDWVQSENANLNRKGHVYRVSSQNLKKSVRFNEPEDRKNQSKDRNLADPERRATPNEYVDTVVGIPGSRDVSIVKGNRKTGPGEPKINLFTNNGARYSNDGSLV